MVAMKAVACRSSLPFARLNITKTSFHLKTSRKAEFRKTRNEIVWAGCVTFERVECA